MRCFSVLAGRQVRNNPPAASYQPNYSLVLYGAAVDLTDATVYATRLREAKLNHSFSLSISAIRSPAIVAEVVCGLLQNPTLHDQVTINVSQSHISRPDAIRIVTALKSADLSCCRQLALYFGSCAADPAGNPTDADALVIELAHAFGEVQLPALLELSLVSNQLTDIAVEALARALQSLQFIPKVLWLMSNRISDTGAIALADSLSTVYRRSNPETLVSGCTDYCQFLSEFNASASINLSGNQIGDGGATAFAQLIAAGLPPKVLSLKANPIAAEGTLALTNALLLTDEFLPDTLPQYFGGNPLVAASAQTLAAALVFSPPTKAYEFKLELDSLGADGTSSMLDAFKQLPVLPSKLQVLGRLSEQPTVVEHLVQFIAAARLPVNFVLDLTGTGVDAATAQKLAEILSAELPIGFRLVLDKNPIDNDGVTALASQLQQAAQLPIAIRLSLADCHSVTDAGAKALAAVFENQALPNGFSFTITSDEFTDLGMQVFVEALKPEKNVTPAVSLNVGGRKLTTVTGSALAAVLENQINRQLKVSLVGHQFHTRNNPLVSYTSDRVKALRRLGVHYSLLLNSLVEVRQLPKAVLNEIFTYLLPHRKNDSAGQQMLLQKLATNSQNRLALYCRRKAEQRRVDEKRKQQTTSKHRLASIGFAMTAAITFLTALAYFAPAVLPLLLIQWFSSTVSVATIALVFGVSAWLYSHSQRPIDLPVAKVDLELMLATSTSPQPASPRSVVLPGTPPNSVSPAMPFYRSDDDGRTDEEGSSSPEPSEAGCDADSEQDRSLPLVVLASGKFLRPSLFSAAEPPQDPEVATAMLGGPASPY